MNSLSSTCPLLICLLLSWASTVEALSSPNKVSGRRTFFAENVLAPSVAIAGLTVTPRVAHSMEKDEIFNQFMFKANQGRARNAERRKRIVAEEAKQQKQQGGGGKFEMPNVGDRVEEIQIGIEERKANARIFDKEETLRSENNDFINELKARSQANQEQYKKDSMRVDKLSYSQFRDQYKRPIYTGVRTGDGEVKMVTAEKLEELKKANRIQVSYEKGTRKDGTEFDDKSKPFLLLIGDDKPKEITSSEPSVEETTPEINGEP